MVLACCWTMVLALPAGAQSPAGAARSARSGSDPELDRWVVLRYRGAGLLPDTASTTPSLASSRVPPRLEQIRASAAGDSLWAVHFSAQPEPPAFATNTTVQLSGPTGVVSPLSARIVARRAFRAPRTPAAALADSSAWRTGWAYLAILPHDAARHPSRYRGWLLLSAPRTMRPARDSR